MTTKWLYKDYYYGWELEDDRWKCSAAAKKVEVDESFLARMAAHEAERVLIQEELRKLNYQ